MIYVNVCKKTKIEIADSVKTQQFRFRLLPLECQLFKYILKSTQRLDLKV